MTIRSALAAVLFSYLSLASAPGADVRIRASVPIISEFLASNETSAKDENGRRRDWIEIHNPTKEAVDLGGWFLTDRKDDLKRWRFPARRLEAGGYLLVFASGDDRRAPSAPLHCDFQLSSQGEYLALVRPDGTIATPCAAQQRTMSCTCSTELGNAIASGFTLGRWLSSTE